MNPTVLIQRVKKPRKPFRNKDGKVVENPFVFGVGGSGLSSNAVELLAPVFSFDYMGAAEYEFGAVQRALQTMANYAKHGKMELVTITVNRKGIKPRYPSKNSVSREEKTAEVYVIGNKDHRDEIRARVELLVTDELLASSNSKKSPEVYLRDYFGLGQYLKYVPEYDDATLGGLELDNGFFITADQEMAQKFFTTFVPPEENEQPQEVSP